MCKSHSGWTRAAFLFVWLTLLAVPALGQSFYGSLVAVVKDDQEKVIPGATITLVNTATSEKREGVSADDGVYRFLNLVPGKYRLEVDLARTAVSAPSSRRSQEASTAIRTASSTAARGPP